MVGDKIDKQKIYDMSENSIILIRIELLAANTGAAAT